MPSAIHKAPIAEDIRATVPKEVHDLLLGLGPESPGLLSSFWVVMGKAFAGVELAYRRGYQAGREDAMREGLRAPGRNAE